MALRRIVRLKVPAAAARPGPAIGQSLGPLGLNMAEFCKQFNERVRRLLLFRNNSLDTLQQKH
jgi:large subunit ribosomal protein L11